jgi:hypothetical protein
MDDDAILKRLFADELKSGEFSDATSIIWDLEVQHPKETSAILKVTSSGYWLDPLRETKAYTWDGRIEVA